MGKELAALKAQPAHAPDLTHDQWDKWQDKHGLILERDALDDIRSMLAAQPAPAQDLPFGVGGGLVAIKTLLSRDPCVHANTAIEMIDAILSAHAQPAPVQEPVAVTYKEVADTMNALWGGTLKQVQIAMELANKKLYTTPPAQPNRGCGRCEDMSKPCDITSGSCAALEDPRNFATPPAAPTVQEPVSQDPITQIQVAAIIAERDATPPAAQRQWVGLTDAEIVSAIYEAEGFDFGLDNGNVSDRAVIEYVRIVEAKLKEKNT
jgi:hypothetical protein